MSDEELRKLRNYFSDKHPFYSKDQWAIDVIDEALARGAQRDEARAALAKAEQERDFIKATMAGQPDERDVVLRALAFEEAARAMLAREGGSLLEALVFAEHIRALATLPPSLVAVSRDSVALIVQLVDLTQRDRGNPLLADSDARALAELRAQGKTHEP